MLRRPLAFILALVFITAIASAAFAVSNYLYEGETSDSVSTTSLIGDFKLVTIGGEKAFVLDEKGEPIKDAGTVDNILKNYYTTEKMPTQAELDDLKALVQKFQDSRNAPAGGLSIKAEKACVDQLALNFFKSAPAWTHKDLNYCYDTNTCVCPPWFPQCQGGQDVTPYGQSAKIILGRSLQGLDDNYTVFQKNIQLTSPDSIVGSMANVKESLTGMKKSARFIMQSIVRAALPPFGTCSAAKLDQDYVDAVIEVTPPQLVPIFNTLLRAGGPQCLDWCYDFPYDMEALGNATAKADELAQKVAPIADSSTEAQAIVENTNKRIRFYDNSVNRVVYGAKYKSNISAEQAELAGRTQIAALKNLVAAELEQVNSLSAQIKANIDADNYDGMAELVAKFQNAYEDADSKLRAAQPSYDKVAKEKERAEIEILKARYNVDRKNAELVQRLNALISRKAEVDKKYAAAPTVPALVQYLPDYTDIADRVKEINEAELTKQTTQLTGLLSGITRSATRTTLSLWNGIQPFPPEKAPENARQVPGILIGVLFFAVVAATLGAFAALTFVYKRIFWRPGVAATWGVIFVVFFAVVGAAFYGLYSVVQEGMGQKTILSDFSNQLRGAPVAAITYSSDNAAPSTLAAMQLCREKLALALAKGGVKAVKQYSFSGDRCTIGPVTKTKSACKTELAGIPHIDLAYSGLGDDATFYTSYETKALIEGSDSYLRTCELARVIV